MLAGGGGYRLSHCSVTRLNPGRLISSEADAVHIADNTGDIIIEDSTFGYQGDDGINIHGAVGAFEREVDNSLHWTAGGESSYAPYGWIAGTDTLRFFNGTFDFLGTTSLQSRSNSKIGLSLKLKDSAPQGATQLTDLSRVSARFVIRNNKFLFNRARGLLLQSSHGLVKNNEFTGQTGHAIIVGAGYSEGPGVQNVIFRGNRFSNVGSFPSTAFPPNSDVRYGAVEVAVLQGAENVKALSPVHEGLIFDANTFSDLRGPGLFISRANDVVVVNNRFRNTNLSRVPDSNPNLNGSIVVLFESIDRRTFAFQACDVSLSDGSPGPAYWLCDVVRVLEAFDESTVAKASGSFLGDTTVVFNETAIGDAHIFVRRTQLSPSARRRAPQFVGSALLWLISLNAREQFFFQPCPALLELLNCRLVTNYGPVTLEKLDDVAVLVTKRVEAFIRRH